MKDDLLNRFEEVEDRHWWWEGRRRLIGDFLKSLGRKNNLKILDVGCGTGGTMSYVKKLNQKFRVWGIDNSRAAVKYTGLRGHKTVKLAKAEKLPFNDQVFDAVLVLDVLEHIKNSRRAIQEIYRVLKPGGKALITSPALKFIWSRHDEGQGHTTRFSRNEISRLGVESGFGIEMARYFNFVLSGPIIAIRILSRIPGMGFVANYDNGVNYGVADITWLNNLLKMIFVAEAGLVRKINYPWGISVAAVMVKPRM